MALLSIPDLVLEKILCYVDLIDLIQNVSVTCTYLNKFVYGRSNLWKQVDFEDLGGPVIFSKSSQLKCVMRHAASFHRLKLPGMTCVFPDFDPVIKEVLNSHLVYAKHCVWLDLSDSQISCLGFLPCMPNLETLIIGGCENVEETEFLHVKSCKKLDFIDASFNKLTSKTVAAMLQPPIEHVDVAGVCINRTDLKCILKKCRSTLFYVCCDIERSTTKQQFVELKRDYPHIVFTICPPRYDFLM